MNEWGRGIRDKSFWRQKSLPKQETSTRLDGTALAGEYAIDLWVAGYEGESFPEEHECELTIPATALANGQRIDFTIQHSDDGVTYESLDPSFTVFVQGAGGLGTPARVIRFRLPAATKRYLACLMSTSAGDCDPSLTGMAELQICF